MAAASAVFSSFQDAFVVNRHDFHALGSGNVSQSARASAATSLPVYCWCLVIISFHIGFLVGARLDRSSATSRQVAVQIEVAITIPDVGDASRHTGGKVSTGLSEDHDAATGHVFATVITDAFDDRLCTTVANTEPFRRAPRK